MEGLAKERKQKITNLESQLKKKKFSLDKIQRTVLKMNQMQL